MPKLTDSMVAGIKPPQSGQAEHPDQLVRGLRLRVGAGGKKSWIVRTRAAGRQINKTLGSYPLLSLSRARENARLFLLDTAARGAPRASRTFGELAEHWVMNVAKKKNRSWRNQERRLELHILSKWRNKKLEHIRRGDVRELIDGVEGVSSPNSVLVLMKTLFRYAVSHEWADHSPADGIERPNKERPRDRVLDMREVCRIYRAADQLEYPSGSFIKMLFLTGQRRTEVASMRWDQLDLQNRTWRLNAADTKPDRAQLIPLTDAALAIIDRVPRFGPHVWTTDGRSHLKAYSKAKSMLDRFVAASGTAIEPWRLHDIRRTVATHLVRLGTTETVVGKLLNHASKGVTATTYALHSYAAEKREALEKWAIELTVQAARPELS